MSPRQTQIAGFVAASLVSAWLFYSRYWQWRDCIRASASGCVTPDGANLTDGGMIWIIPAVGFAAAAGRVLLGIPWRRPTPPPV